jgi:hypothetical protein
VPNPVQALAMHTCQPKRQGLVVPRFY